VTIDAPLDAVNISHNIVPNNKKTENKRRDQNNQQEVCRIN
jgi:hypothetical protein